MEEWILLAVAMVGLLASGPGQSHTFSVFVGPLSEALSLSRTELASAYGFATLVAAFGLPYSGRLTDRFGPRIMLRMLIRSPFTRPVPHIRPSPPRKAS